MSEIGKTLDVNIRGYFYMSANAVKLMEEHGGGSIINVASVGAIVPGDFQGVYSMTKAAVISMTKAYAKEYAARGVRVNAILPGGTDTKLAAAWIGDPEVLGAALHHIPIGRVAAPSEMAGAVLYFASSASSYTTGACLNIDGGYLIA